MATSRSMSEVVVVDDPNTHYYFALHGLCGPPIEADKDGRIAVYTDRNRCHAAAAALVANDELPIFVVGMADEKWKLFQDEIAHYLVD